MAQEQIDKECDALVDKFRPFSFVSVIPESETINATQNAILHQTGIVDTLRKLKLPFNNAELTDAYAVVDYRLDIAQQILETLKSRVK